MKITVTAPNGDSAAPSPKSLQKPPKSQYFRDIYLVKYYQDNRTENCIPKK